MFTKLTLVARGFRHTPGDLHITTFFRGGKRPNHTICGQAIDGMRSVVLPFNDWFLALCPDCDRVMDDMLDSMSR